MPPMLSACSRGPLCRRTFLADVGMGITGLALGVMLHQDGILRAAAPPARRAVGRHPRGKASFARLLLGVARELGCQT